MEGNRPLQKDLWAAGAVQMSEAALKDSWRAAPVQPQKQADWRGCSISPCQLVPNCLALVRTQDPALSLNWKFREQKPLQIKGKKCHLWMEEVFYVAKPKTLTFPPSPLHHGREKGHMAKTAPVPCSCEWRRPPPARGVGLLLPREGLTHPVFESGS